VIAQLPDALPMPCLTCGAAMTPSEAAPLHADPRLRCSFCGREEPMPHDAAERHRHLRLRLLQVRRARELAEAPIETQRTLRAAWGFGLAALIPLAGWQWYHAFQGQAPTQTVVFAMLSGAAMVGIATGYVGMARTFARWVAPILRARPPHAQGLAARCRSCGAPIPAIRAPSVTCAHCGATNLLDLALTRDASELLAAERAEHERRAMGGLGADPNAYRAPAVAFRRWGLIGASVALIVGALVALATGRLG